MIRAYVRWALGWHVSVLSYESARWKIHDASMAGGALHAAPLGVTSVAFPLKTYSASTLWMQDGHIPYRIQPVSGSNVGQSPYSCGTRSIL
jgi:hypothetical protein